MHLNSWDYYELEKELHNATPYQLLEIYRREDKKYLKKCVEYTRLLNSLTQDGKEELEKECEFLKGTKIKVALRIAETLTKK